MDPHGDERVTGRFPECTCGAPDDAEPEDHDNDCPENPGWDNEE